jgi:hypothetical protein
MVKGDKTMSRDKQIDAIYEDLVEIFDEEYGKRNLITPQNTAEKMTAKGYRKASDVAEEIFAEIGKLRPITKLVIKGLGEWDFDKDGEKFYWISETKIVELKKKYTQEK